MSAPHHRRHGARGFTLIEVIIALVIGLILVSVTFDVLIVAQTTQRDGQLKSFVTRDAMYALDVVGGDLANAGVGVPRGQTADVTALGARVSAPLRPVVRAAEAHRLAFVGDLAYPNADLNGTAIVQAIEGPGPTSANILVASDLSTCAPKDGAVTSSYDCPSPERGLLDLGGPGGACDSSNRNSQHCPWGLNKWQGPGGLTHLTLTNSRGDWVQRAVAMDGLGPTTLVPVNGALGVGFAVGVPATGTTHLVDNALFEGTIAGVASIAQLDRVLYAVEEEDGSPCLSTQCVLRRRQCWGEIGDTSAPGFPGPGVSMGSAESPNACTAPVDGTRWEQVINGIESFTFRYYADNLTTPLPVPVSVADLPRIRTVEMVVTVSRPSPMRPGDRLRQTMTRRFHLENGDGFGVRGRL